MSNCPPKCAAAFDPFHHVCLASGKIIIKGLNDKPSTAVLLMVVGATCKTANGKRKARPQPPPPPPPVAAPSSGAALVYAPALLLALRGLAALDF